MSTEGKQYIFSAFVPEVVKCTVKPKCWQFWKKPVVTESTRWVSKYVILNEREAALLLDFNLSNPVVTLFFKGFSTGGSSYITNAYLEEIYKYPQYIKTSTNDSL